MVKAAKHSRPIKKVKKSPVKPKNDIVSTRKRKKKGYLSTPAEQDEAARRVEQEYFGVPVDDEDEG